MAGVVPAVAAVSLTRAVATVPVVAVRLLERRRMERIVTAPVVSRRLVQPVPPGRLTRPRVARRGRAPDGAHSKGRLGRTSGSRDSLHLSMTLPRRPADRADAVAIRAIPHPHATSIRALVAKTTAPTFAATKWRVCPFCVLGWHHRNGSQAARVASLGNSESGDIASNECSWNVWDKGSKRLAHKKASSWLARSK